MQVLPTTDLQRPLGGAHFHPSGSLHGQGPCGRLQPEEKNERGLRFSARVSCFQDSVTTLTARMIQQLTTDVAFKVELLVIQFIVFEYSCVIASLGLHEGI